MPPCRTTAVAKRTPLISSLGRDARPLTRRFVPGGPFLLSLASHSARHTAQIREVEGNAGYPRERRNTWGGPLAFTKADQLRIAAQPVERYERLGDCAGHGPAPLGCAAGILPVKANIHEPP
jgi:hypothetical protein